MAGRSLFQKGAHWRLVPTISDEGWPVRFSRAWFQCVMVWSRFKTKVGMLLP
jgi:hypothetical protein